MNNIYHTSVLLQETIDGLSIKKGGKYIDATLGGGGHTKAILDMGGMVLGIDVDQDSIDYVKEKLKEYEHLKIIRGNFRDIDEIARQNGFEKVSGIVMDLGVSSHQIDEEKRGFSYLKNGPLDMRMDMSQTLKAADLLNILEKGELNEIFNKFGQDSRSNAISNGIVGARRIKAFENTSDLVEVIKNAYGIRGEISNMKKAQISNRIFQALRIAVNDELGSLREALKKSASILEENGRIAVISFHSLEDRIVKKTFIEMQQENLGFVINKKPIIPTLFEINQNRRSKSSKLRIFEKI